MHTQLTTPVASPAAGADWSYQLSNSERVQLLSIVASLTTSATAGSRDVVLQAVDVNGQTLSLDASETFEAISSTVRYSWRPGNNQYGLSAAGTIYSASCPSFWLPPGARVSTATSGLSVTDQWSGIFITYLVQDHYDRLVAEEELIAALGPS